MRNRTALFVLSAVLLFGCERPIDFDLKDQSPKLVVEATIENGEAPQVILTHSVGYFSELSLEILSNSFVHNAEVFVSNGIKTHRLKEYAIPVGGGYSVYYYSTDSSSLNTAFVGELNRGYSLRIVSNGKEYRSNTTIPKITKVIDSLWWKPSPVLADTPKVIVMIKATDPPGYGDYIRYFTKRNQERYYPPYNSVFDDLFVDGTTYELQLDHGVDRNAIGDNKNQWFKRGDTITLKLSNIDKATYDFWRTMEYSYGSVGNPFSTPTKVLSNISNDALGYFGGYATQYRTLIIPH